MESRERRQVPASETSILALRGKVLRHGLAKSRRLVLQAIAALCKQQGSCCDKQIADYLGWPINRVTPRRGELLQTSLDRAFLIEDLGAMETKLSKTKMHYYRIAEAGKRVLAGEARFNQQFEYVERSASGHQLEMF